jgi:hypothetical protein
MFALSMALDIVKSDFEFPLFFFENKPQIEKYLSMQADEEFIFNNISASLVNLDIS